MLEQVSNMKLKLECILSFSWIQEVLINNQIVLIITSENIIT